MTDDLNQKTNQPTKDGPDKSADNQSKEKIGVLILEVFGVGVFGFLLNVFFSTDHKILGIWFTFLAIASLIALFATTTATRYAAQKVWWLYGLIHLALATWFAIWTYSLVQLETATQHVDVAHMAELAITKVWCDPPIPEVGKPLLVKIGYNNIGKTAARNCVIRAVVDPVQKGETPNFDYSKEKPIEIGFLPSIPDGFQTTLHPVRRKSTDESASLTQELYDKLAMGQIQLFTHGRIDYKDISGKPHFLTFCFFLITPFNEHFGFCVGHNESDDRSK